MSHNFAKQFLEQRNEFLQHLQNDLNKINEIINETNNNIDELNKTINNINELKQKIQHNSLIPLGKRIYVDGTIKHTNEYFIDQLATPNSFTIEQTSENTLKLLEERLKNYRNILVRNEQNREQLVKRIELLNGESVDNLTINDNNNDDDDNDNRREEIITDRGVAVRVGEFYEILEFEE